MQKLWCLSFIMFEYIAKQYKWTEKVPDDIAVISINNGKDAGSDEEYHCCHGDNVLNLDFDDIDPVALELDETAETYLHKTKHGDIIIQFFTDEMAKKSVEFIEKYKDRNFFIHCSAGISRSQAFVKYIKNVYFETEWMTNPDNECEFPNGFVYSKLMNAYRNQ